MPRDRLGRWPVFARTGQDECHDRHRDRQLGVRSRRGVDVGIEARNRHDNGNTSCDEPAVVQTFFAWAETTACVHHVRTGTVDATW